MNGKRGNRLPWALAGALLALNLAVLGSIWLGPGRTRHHPPPPHHGPPRLVERLSMTPEQEAAFAPLRRAHREAMHEIHDALRNARDDIFRQLTSERPDTAAVHSAAGAIGRLQARIETLNFTHFREVRALLDTRQTRRFGALIGDILHEIGGGKRPVRP